MASPDRGAALRDVTPGEPRRSGQPPADRLGRTRQAASHRVAIRPQVLARLDRKRGGRHPFRDIEASRAAHVVVDLQAAYLVPGAPFEIPAARSILPNVNALSQAVRSAGGLVVILQHTVDEAALRSWSVYYDHIVGADRRRLLAEALRPGSPGHAVWPDLDVQPGDWQVCKTRFGAFMAGSSDLHERLQSRGIDSIILSGTATNCCVESTAREAMSLNYRTFVASDATATDTDGEHNASLSMLLNTFADVRATRGIIALLEAA